MRAARGITTSFIFASIDESALVAGEHSPLERCDEDAATTDAVHAPVYHAPAGDHDAQCLEADLPARKRTRRGSSGLRWADDAPSGELYSVEYVETLHGLPLDASERDRRAFFASLHRSKLRQRAVKRLHGERRTAQNEEKRKKEYHCEEPTKPGGTHSAAYLLCKGGVQGARQSAQALEMELEMLEII